MNIPKYRVNQVLRNLLPWARDIPPRPVIDVQWDEVWECYTYSFPDRTGVLANRKVACGWSCRASLIRIGEHNLEPTGDPDIEPDAWVASYMSRP